jgi:hypothetical protein
MKNLLAKFYKSLACRVALAIVATTSVAKPHDFPQHFPLAPTDWGMIQQDCLGYQNTGYTANDLPLATNQELEIAVAIPDSGNPPEPIVTQLAVDSLIGPELYDGVDCSKLESYYRNYQQNRQAEHLVEYKPDVTPPTVDNTAIPQLAQFEFHRSFFAACSCDFESSLANQSILPPTLTLKRTYVEDQFANEFNCMKPLLLRDYGRRGELDSGLTQFSAIQFESLAVAIPTVPAKNKELLSTALSQLASYDCIVRSELYSGRHAIHVGEFASTLATAWVARVVPSATRFIAEYANSWKPANNLTTPAPMFVIFQNAAGYEVAIPISQARDWEQAGPEVDIAEVKVSQEFKDLMDTANARLQWAGGRLSAAANLMSDWISDRMARTTSSELR